MAESCQKPLRFRQPLCRCIKGYSRTDFVPLSQAHSFPAGSFMLNIVYPGKYQVGACDNFG